VPPALRYRYSFDPQLGVVSIDLNADENRDQVLHLRVGLGLLRH